MGKDRKNASSTWLNHNIMVKKSIICNLFDKEKDKIAGLMNVWQFIKKAAVPVEDIGNIFFWLMEEKGITEADLKDFDSIIIAKTDEN